MKPQQTTYQLIFLKYRCIKCSSTLLSLDLLEKREAIRPFYNLSYVHWIRKTLGPVLQLAAQARSACLRLKSLVPAKLSCFAPRPWQHFRSLLFDDQGLQHQLRHIFISVCQISQKNIIFLSFSLQDSYYKVSADAIRCVGKASQLLGSAPVGFLRASYWIKRSLNAFRVFHTFSSLLFRIMLWTQFMTIRIRRHSALDLSVRFKDYFPECWKRQNHKMPTRSDSQAAYFAIFLHLQAANFLPSSPFSYFIGSQRSCNHNSQLYARQRSRDFCRTGNFSSPFNLFKEISCVHLPTKK